MNYVTRRFANPVLPLLLLCPLLATNVALAQVTLTKSVIDAAMAGDVKIAADIDGDGFKDLVVGGSPGEDLNWYRYPTWTKTRIALASFEFTTDGDAADVDGDGDIDIVVPDGSGTNTCSGSRSEERPLGFRQPFRHGAMAQTHHRHDRALATGHRTGGLRQQRLDGRRDAHRGPRLLLPDEPNAWLQVT